MCNEDKLNSNSVNLVFYRSISNVGVMAGENRPIAMKSDLTLESHFSLESLEKVSDCNLVILRNVFKEECARSLADEVTNLRFTYSNNDLHSMSQTDDFSNLDDLPKFCSQFLQFLHTSALGSVLSESFGLDKVSRITTTASLYKQNDYLLCHDDQVGDRSVAFIFYLTENWESSDGGQLKFFSYDKFKNEPLVDSYRKILVPEFNAMALFLVNDSSFHEVEQVFGTKPRISINGWFHTDNPLVTGTSRNSPGLNKNVEPQRLFLKAPLFTFAEPLSDLLAKGILSPEYRAPVTWKQMAKVISSQPRLFGYDFLASKFSKEVANELSSCTSWSFTGPPFRRRYETLEVINGDSGIFVEDDHSNKLNVLLNFLRSSSWLQFLCSVTNLDLAVLEEGLVPPTCMVEVQRWQTGCYTALAAHDIVQAQPSVEISLFFNVDTSTSFQERADKGNESIIHILKNNESRIQKRLETISVIKKKAAILRWRFQNRKINSIRASSQRKTEHSKKVPAYVMLSKNVIRRLHQSVDNKMERIKEYRKSRGTDEVAFVTPTENSIFLSLNSKNTNKYTSFLLKNNQDDNSIKYHCVNVTYLTASSFDD